MTSANDSLASVVDHPAFRQSHALPEKPSYFTFSVPSASCSRCIQKIELGLGELNSVQTARLDLGRKILHVQLSSSESSLKPILSTLEGLGFEAYPVPVATSEAKGLETHRREMIEVGVAAACAGNIMLLSIAQYAGAADSEYDFLFGLISLGLFIPVLTFSARSFFRNVWQALRLKKASIDLAVVAALTAGTGFSLIHLIQGSGETYFDSLAALVFLLLASRKFLASLQARHQESISQLRFLSSQAVEKRVQDAFTWVPVAALQPGDLIRVAPQQTLPADGELVDDQQSLNLSVLTGESRPVKVFKGAPVFAGSITMERPVLMRVTQLGEETRVGKILAGLKNASLSRTPLVSLTDRVGQWFTLLVLAAGLIFTVAFWSIDPAEGLKRALALTLLACPCALALATPLAQGLALSRLAHRRVIVKSAEAIERLPSLKNAFFDKTGTLTWGNLKLVQSLPEVLPSPLPSVIRALEKSSLHPVARALSEAYSSASEIQVSHFKETPGRGVEGYYQGRHYTLQATPPPSHLQASSSIWVGLFEDEILQAQFELADQIRPEAQGVIDILRQRGMKSWLLTGDRQATANYIAEIVRIPSDHVYAEAQPEDKAQIVSQSEQSLVIGDGINDALALASADVSVAMHGGIEGALRASDVYLASQNLRSLLDLFVVADETRVVVFRNLGFSLIYNLTGATLALMGHIHPLLAAILMPVSSVTLMASVLWGTRRMRALSREMVS